jgi:predicted GH43/DUF377 family glycosyl hydrolase
MTGEASLAVDSAHERLGIVLTPEGPLEEEGVLNPAIVRDRNGVLLMYPRMVARGNVSRIGLVRGNERDDTFAFERLGIALEAERPYESRAAAGGHGCEDPRVTFVPRLDAFVMAYTAYGEAGPRIALAVSDDGYAWTRLGLLRFADQALNDRDNKDAALFPEPVRSPSGALALLMYHRPMLPGAVNGQTPIPTILALEPAAREHMAVGYIPLEPVLRDIAKLVEVAESQSVVAIDPHFGALKNGCGTPPVRIAAGWLSFFHAVDAVERNGTTGLLYRAGLLVHDAERPAALRYRSPAAILGPVTAAERFGTVDDVVFPTGIDVRGPETFDVYYGAADARIARARFTVRVRE